MKIYKELILQANPTKNTFTKVSEVSEEYDGPLAECAYLPGDDEIGIHCYSVFIRNHQYAAQEPWTSGIVNVDAAATTLLETEVDWWAEAPVNGKIPVAKCENFGIIGRLEEKPTAKTSDGQTIKLEDCNEVGLSDIVEVNLSHLQVNAGNWKQLRALAKTGNVDILFVEKSKITTVEIEAIAISDIKIRVNIEITGNDKNSMPMTAKKEVGDATTVFDIIEVKLAA